ncbi:hypothetical protein D3C87_965560 [compost metagenome]
MSDKTAGYVLLGVMSAALGFKAYCNFKRNREHKAKMAQVRSTVAHLIKDVPGYNKPSR